MEPVIRKTVLLSRNIRDWMLARLFFGFIAILKLFPPDRAINFCAEAARGLGMRYARTKLARENLKLAFPEKPCEEIERILGEMWANLGRTAAEYVYLDQIFSINEDNQSQGRVEITGEEHFHAMKNMDGPAITFTAHTGNWEILPIASAYFGLDITALFRPPNNRYIAERVLSARTTAMGHLVPSKAGASWALAEVLDEGKKVGLLVDQFFARGYEINFLGRKTMANPLISKLTRQFECPVVPARCIRLPDNRFRIEIEKPLELPKTADGKLDQKRLIQMVNDRVAEWIEEYPEQWLWLHKRWRPEFMAKRAERMAADPRLAKRDRG